MYEKWNVFCDTLPQKYIIVVVTYLTEAGRYWARMIEALTSLRVCGIDWSQEEVGRRERSLEVDVEAAELTHATHEAVEADCLQARTQEGWRYRFQSKGRRRWCLCSSVRPRGREGEGGRGDVSLPLPFCSIQILNELNQTQLRLKQQSAFLSLPLLMLISSGNLFTDTTGNMPERCMAAVRLTHKINHHRCWEGSHISQKSKEEIWLQN